MKRNVINQLVEDIQGIFAVNNICVHSDAIETALIGGTDADADVNDLIETLVNYCEPTSELDRIITRIKRATKQEV